MDNVDVIHRRREHLENVMHDNAVANIDITVGNALDRSDDTEESLRNLLQHGVDESYSLKVFPPAGHALSDHCRRGERPICEHLT